MSIYASATTSKTKPIQTQFKPNQSQSNPISTLLRRKQTQSNPIFLSFYLTHAAYLPQSNPISTHPLNSCPPYLMQRRIEFLLFRHLTFNQFFIFKFTNQQIPHFDIRRLSHQKTGFFIGGNTVSTLQNQFWIQPG